MFNIYSLLFALSVTLFATDSSLDSKIELLKNAPKEERYKIMNEIKMELIKLNESQREQMMQKLFQSKKGTPAKMQRLHSPQNTHEHQKSFEQKQHDMKTKDHKNFSDNMQKGQKGFKHNR